MNYIIKSLKNANLQSIKLNLKIKLQDGNKCLNTYLLCLVLIFIQIILHEGTFSPYENFYLS